MMKKAIYYGIAPFRKRGIPLDTHKRQKKIKLSKNMHPTKKILQAVKIGEDRDKIKQNSSSSFLIIEELGILIGIIRRKKEYSREKLASRIGILPEALFALEAGILHPLHFCEVLPLVLEAIDIPLHKLAENLRKENVII
jgi:DNA-binding XRE family transcriptional regulator